ncbi:MAG: hypothetical protein ABL971_00105 [Vicinamibacterales bacterium]
MIFLCEHETQGIAYQQALSSGVPLLAWDRSGNWKDPSYYPEQVRFEPVSSVPYWDERCGMKFADANRIQASLDAEDFHSGQLFRPEEQKERALSAGIEQRMLPQCGSVTAAAPAIAEVYRDSCGIPLPASVLNVFPRADRPEQVRAVSSAVAGCRAQ